MVEFFKKEEFFVAKKKRNIVLGIYLAILAVYLIVSEGLFLWYTTFPYGSTGINTVKLIEYPLSAVFILFSFIYLGIPFKRINKYYNLLRNMLIGKRETSTGSFLEYDESVEVKDGVDCKTMLFLEWNKYKKDFFERKVLVFNEKEFPQFSESANVKYVTHGNVLVAYEILEDEEN